MHSIQLGGRGEIRRKKSGTWVNTILRFQLPLKKRYMTPGGLPYKKGRDARWKFYIKLLKETNLGVAQALFDP